MSIFLSLFIVNLHASQFDRFSMTRWSSYGFIVRWTPPARPTRSQLNQPFISGIISPLTSLNRLLHQWELRNYNVAVEVWRTSNQLFLATGTRWQRKILFQAVIEIRHSFSMPLIYISRFYFFFCFKSICRRNVRACKFPSLNIQIDRCD